MKSVTLASVRREPAPRGEFHMSHIADLLRPKDILLDVDVANKANLFEIIDQHMVLAHGMVKGFTTINLNNRERIGSTALGDGVAVPHAHVKCLFDVQLLYIRLKSPIPFDAPDNEPVVDVLALLVPTQANQLHLRILAEITHTFSDHRFRMELHQCMTNSDVMQLLSSRKRWQWEVQHGYNLST
jgi:PTS system nitrogen regulatory IIA component